MEVMHGIARRRLAQGLLVGLLLTAAATAGSEERIVRRETVRYADLDLNSPEGVQALRHRIRAAVKVVCGPTPELRELNEMRAEQQCRYQALRQATARVEAILADVRDTGARVAAR